MDTVFHFTQTQKTISFSSMVIPVRGNAGDVRLANGECNAITCFDITAMS